MSTSARHGFTLIEVMVSILIFSVMSIAMIGVFSAATSIFRAGESARAATDEATAVLAMIDDDLKRMVAPQDGGFFFTTVNMPIPGVPPAPVAFVAEPGGNMVLSFKIRNPDPGAISEAGIGARLIVLYWVEEETLGSGTWALHRATATAADSDNVPATTSELAVMNSIYRSADSVVARGCLYLGVDLSTPNSVRNSLNWSMCEPLINMIGVYRYCTEPNATYPDVQAYPDAFRISLSITGGNRFGAKGTLISDDGTGIRVAGVKQVPIIGGAFARIGDPGTPNVEWVRYDNFVKGKMTFQGADVVRDLRRTTHTGAHPRGLAVYFCPTFTLVRTLPR